MPFFVLMLIWGLLELFIIILMTDMIGALTTIGLLLAGVVGGLWLIRGQQVRWLSMVQSERQPHQLDAKSLDMKDGMFRLLGGILFILPGFLSDILAILLIVPKLRALIGQQLLRLFRMDVMVSKFAYRQQGNVYEHDENTVKATDEDGNVIEGTLEDSNFRDRD